MSHDLIEAPSSMQTALKEYVELEHRRRREEDTLEAIAERQKQLEQQLLDQFADTGLQNARVDGLTVYIRRDKYVSRKPECTSEQVCEALREVGLGYMVAPGYNPASLKAKIAEYKVNETEVPEQLASLLNIGETFKLATRL